MAKNAPVWGIDIGNCSLKALRCHLGEGPHALIADAFDYIEYPKILTQPDAEPPELIQDALKQFLSRNQIRGSRVAISVSGQNGLARFIKLPPVETKKIAAIVQYEARQQIPFDLDDVIWDYQRMGGGAEEEGFVLDVEVGLFAMKRDQVFRAMEPLERAGIDLDVIQLTPLALYNFMAFDQLRDLPSADEYDPDNPPPSVIVLSLGTDATDLVITNGMRVWQRSIPLGGNHFTKALTKELKLTFAKAEHLKRNAATAQDPKAVFQAMRPVFNDLLTEIQRSIGYFSSVDRAAKVERMLALGNTIKLPGLRRYLAQSLGFEVDRLAAFSGLSGAEVIGSPAFEENLSSFAVCHGLCVQGLQSAALRTNLLPKEIVKDRIIKSKKPWAVAAAAVLLLGCTLSIASHAMGVRTVDKGLFASAEQQAEEVKKAADDFKSQATTVQADIKKNETVGRNVVDSVAGRTRWLELLKAVFDSLPQDGKVQPNDVEERNRIQVTSITCSQIDKDGANTFLKYMVGKGWYVPTPEESAAAGLPSDPSAGGTGAPSPGTPAATSAAPAPAAATSGSDTAAGSGAADNPGGVWGIQLNCFHYHNSDSAMRKGNYGAEFVRNTLIKNLRDGQTMVPNGDLNKPEWVSNRDLGILYPTIVNPLKPEEVTITPGAEGDSGENRSAPVAPRAGSGSSGMMPGGPLGGMPHMPTSGPGGMGMMPGMSSPGMSSPGMSFPGSSTAARSTGGMDKEAIKVKRFSFYVQFIWQPVSPAERKKLQEARAQAQAASQNPAGQGSGTGPGANSGTLAPGPAAPAGVPSQAAPAPAVPSAPLAPAGAANPTSTKP